MPDDLYYVVIDPIGKDKDTKELTLKHSLVTIQVWMYPNNISNSVGDILVGQYIGRPIEESETAEMVVRICEKYNAKALPETDRGTTVADLRRLGKLNILLRDPTIIVNNPNRITTSAPYGMNIGGGSKAEDGLIYFKDFLYQKVGENEDGTVFYNLHYIPDLGLIRELVKFKKNGNFDRIAAARLMVFQRIAYRTLRKKAKTANTNHKTTLSSLGLYNKN